MKSEEAMERVLFLLQAHQKGKAALVSCKEKSTGKVVMLACVVIPQDGGVIVTPIARVFDEESNPFDEYAIMTTTVH